MDISNYFKSIAGYVLVRNTKFKTEEEILYYIKMHKSDWYVIRDFPVEISCNGGFFDKVIDILCDDGFGGDYIKKEILKRLGEVYSSNHYKFSDEENMRRKIFGEFYIERKIRDFNSI